MARLTRDFSGRHAGGGFAKRAIAPAWAKPVMEKRAAGARIGLLLVSVDGWDGGWYLKEREHVERVCTLPDFDIATGDWSVVAGLDVLVCGDAEQDRFDLAVLACLRASAASVWVECAAGMVRVEFWRWSAPYFVAAADPVPTGRFGTALAAFRETALLLGDGFYADPAFQPARTALLDRLMGNVPPAATTGAAALRNCYVLAGDRGEGIRFATARGFGNLEIQHVEDLQTLRVLRDRRGGDVVHVLPGAVKRANYVELLDAARNWCRVVMEGMEAAT